MIYSEYDMRILPQVFLVILFVVVILSFLLRRKSERVRAIPTAIVAVMLLFIEVVKQRWNLRGEFELFHLPFHYCSLFFLVIPLAELGGKHLSHIFRPIATCMTFLVSVAMYVYPNAIMGTATETLGKDFKETHGFIFHHLILLYFFLVIGMRLCRPRVRDAFHMGGIGMAYTAVVLPLAVNLDVNYCNFQYSVIPFLESLRLEYGQALYTLLIVFFITVGATFSAFVYLALYHAVDMIYKGFRWCFHQIKKKCA